MLMRLPRTFRNSSSGSFRMSWPRKRISPLIRAVFLLISPSTVSQVTFFPEPDSPTTPRVSPAEMAMETPSTALTTPSSLGKWTLRSLISRSGSATGPLTTSRTSDRARASRVPHPGIEECIDDIHDEVRQHDEEGGEDRYPHGRGEVLPGQGVHQVRPDAVEVEHLLG